MHLDYIKKKRIQIFETKGQEFEPRIVIKVSDSAYALCNPDKEEKNKRGFDSESSIG